MQVKHKNTSIVRKYTYLYSLTPPAPTLVQGLRSASNMNINEPLDLNGHIKAKPMRKFENQSHMNNSSLKTVLSAKLYNIKLSKSVFRVAMFFQFESTKLH